MPHEVIMPALGMAQDTGHIVAWLKSPGDSVKAGDALMEVETDKATMEVEAAHDGYLTDVRASAGQDVPVGDVVAMIADSPDAIRVPEPADGTPAAEDAEDGTTEAEVPEGHQVIMPALGMAQDSGVVVAWAKAAGDAVSEGDTLLEVETDKATMEVEADRAGYLAAILAEDGDDVPVGQVIAVISAEAPATPIRRAMAAAPADTSAATAGATPATEREPAPEPKAEAPSASEPRRPVTPAAPGGRILASPKAKRLAAEEGLDLADLAAAGHPQPYHVADLETLRVLARETAARPAAAAGGAARPSEIEAEVPAAAHDAFLTWLAAEGASPAPGRILAAFTAGALRAVNEPEGARVVSAGGGGSARLTADPDRAPLNAAPLDVEGVPALVVRDLTGTALTALRPAAPAAPTLTLSRRGDALALHLAHDEATLSQDAALALISGVAVRLADPLRHLL